MAQDQPAFDLLGLPQEIILQIIEHEVEIEDLDNFVLCSKTIFTLASRVLAKHQEMKKKYSTFIIGDMDIDYRSREIWKAPRELYPVVAASKLLANPAVAEYCKILKVGDFFSNRNWGDGTTKLAVALTSKLEPYARFTDVRRFTTLRATCPHVLAWAVPFVELQNIEVLELAIGGITFLNLVPIVRAMQKTHHRLKEVRLFGEIVDMDLLYRFATIPSVQIIRGHHVPHVAYGYKDLCPDGACLSIEELHLENSDLGGRIFEDLLSHTKALRVLFYEHGRYTGSDYEPRRALEALGKYGSESLQSLTFIDPEILVAHDDKPGVSLRDFKVLKHVAVDSFLLVDEVKYYDYTDSPSDNGVPRLVDILPQSLQTLELYRPPPHGIRRLFEGLAELREERLPNLKSITLHKGSPSGDGHAQSDFLVSNGLEDDINIWHKGYLPVRADFGDLGSSSSRRELDWSTVVAV
ncbi:MAG: hypothetical protein L6R36_005745 [Xanthoria steineri]|nr:MAG: hypothetical protein L6R36_005745 [Xanthoria steineri]